MRAAFRRAHQRPGASPALKTEQVERDEEHCAIIGPAPPPLEMPNAIIIAGDRLPIDETGSAPQSSTACLTSG
jgi:hypothetical protein